MQNLPRFLSDFRLTAHVWTKYFRNADRTVCLKIVLEKCDQHSRRSYYCVVQCVCEIFVSVTSFYTEDVYKRQIFISFFIYIRLRFQICIEISIITTDTIIRKL